MIRGFYDERYFFGPRAGLNLKAPTLEQPHGLLK